MLVAMIIRPKKHLPMMYILQGSFFYKLWKPLLGLFIFSALIAYFHSNLNQVQLNASMFTLLGIALAIFHGFCNNAAYDRFWEARKHWGALILVSRSLVRKLLSFDQPAGAATKESTLLVIAFAHALRHQLRFSDASEDLKRILPSALGKEVAEYPYHVLIITRLLSDCIPALHREGSIDSLQWKALDEDLHELTHIQAACERISNTPIPFAYFVLLNRTVYGYCFLLPFGLVNTIGWVTPVMVTFVGYTFMALNEIVDEISEPFGTAENDLALSQMCTTIETQLSLMSEQTTPPQPVDKVSKAFVVL